MDFKKIFLKEGCPTPIGGQAIMEGIVMKGVQRTALALRLPTGQIYLRTRPNRLPPKWVKFPLIRGVYSLFTAMVDGTKDLMDSATILEKYTPNNEVNQGNDPLERWLSKRFGEKKAWNIMIYLSVIVALIVSIGVFFLLPTVFTGLFKGVIENKIVLNFMEGFIRLGFFVLYVWAISKMEEIKTVFQYHGAEHKTIHCFEQGLELTPENAQSFYTLHPRCGTSFLMIIVIVTLLIFPLLGWPNLALRLLSRFILIPVIAGISYEILKWAGRSDSILVKILSIPGLYMQKITTNEPTLEQLEVAILAMKAVLASEDEKFFEDNQGGIIYDNAR